MMISTKGRYALRVMIDLAQHSDDGFVSLKEISERQQISMKYLELIVSVLNKSGALISMRGAHGGYKLARPAEEYNVSYIMKLTEGNLAPVSCIECGESLCEKAGSCLTLPMWLHLDSLINDYLSGISIKDLAEGKIK